MMDPLYVFVRLGAFLCFGKSAPAPRSSLENFLGFFPLVNKRAPDTKRIKLLPLTFFLHGGTYLQSADYVFVERSQS